MTDEVTHVFVIEVEADPEPAECSVSLQCRPPIRGAISWSDSYRKLADEHAREILCDREGAMQFREDGHHRRYRIPSKLKDGWSACPPVESIP